MLSSPAPVRSGVPLGSVLGTLLFLVYINDLTDIISSRSLLYADDLKIWTSDNPDVLQEDIISIKKLVDLVEPSHKRYQMRPYVTWRCLRETALSSTTVPRQMTILLSTSRRTWVFGSHPAYPSHITHALAAKKGFTVFEYESEETFSTDQP